MATPLKILFADDDLKYSLLLKRFLEKEGYDVTYTGNGTMALEQFPVVLPDLVLLDINMPGLNGFEVAEKIRETDRHVLIFFLSDRSDKTDRLERFQPQGERLSCQTLLSGRTVSTNPGTFRSKHRGGSSRRNLSLRKYSLRLFYQRDPDREQ